MDSAQLLTSGGLGAIVGLILALSGAGGGILAVPLLIFGLGLTMTEAAPVGLIAVGMAAALGAILGLREGIVRYRAAMLVSTFGIASAPLGLWLAHRLPDTPLMMAFAAVLVYVAQRMFRRARAEQKNGAPLPREMPMPCVINPREGRFQWTLPCAQMMSGTGLLSGVLSGLLGVGGGFVIVPALTRATDLDMRSIIATSLAVIALVSVGTVASASVAGVVRWDIGLPFGAGAIIGLLAGRRIARALSGPHLQQIFAVIALAAALSLLTRGARALLGA